MDESSEADKQINEYRVRGLSTGSQRSSSANVTKYCTRDTYYVSWKTHSFAISTLILSQKAPVSFAMVVCPSVACISKDPTRRISVKPDDDMIIHLLTAIGLTPGGSTTVHVYIQTVHRKT
jgi:hypothetical protein